MGQSLDALTYYNAARTALEKLHSIDEVMQVRDKALAVRLYAAQKKDTRLLKLANEVKRRAERRLGEILIETGKNGGRAKRGGDKKSTSAREEIDHPPTLAELGLSFNESSDCQKLARMPEEKFEALVAKTAEAVAGLSTFQANRIANTSNGAARGKRNVDGEIESDCWHTPAYIIELAQALMGAIDLDPASNQAAQATVLAKSFFSKSDDALNRNWHGRVYLNPPYSQPLIGQFIAKLVAEFQAKRVSQAVVLVNNATDTRWFQALADAGHVMFTRQRIQFSRPGDDKPGSPRQGQAIFYLGEKHAAFIKLFSGIAYGVR